MSQTDAIWLVTFYAPWDENAHDFSPRLEAAAADLKKHGYKINFGAIDVSQNQQIGYKYGIDASPTVKIFWNQDSQWIATDYTGEGETDSVKDFCTDFYMQKNIPYSDLPEGFIDGQLVELTDANFDDVFMKSNEIWLIKFSAPWCYHCNQMLPSWTAAAKELGAKVRFAVIDVDANKWLARRFNVQKLPELRFYQAGYGKTIQKGQEYTGSRSEHDLAAFAYSLRLKYDADPHAFQVAPCLSGQCFAADMVHESNGGECRHSEFSYEDDGQKGCDIASLIQEQEVCVGPHCEIPSAVPGELKELCDDGCLCIVAFIPDDVHKKS